MASKSMVEQFVVGIIRGTHGVKGEIKVESTSGEYEHFARMEEVALSDGTSSKPVKIEAIRTGNNVLYMKLEGINTPEDAAKFNRWQIVVPRKYAHKLQKDEWYIEDLKGCSVWYENKADVIGTVTNVMEGGSGYLVEILLSEACSLIDDKIKYNKNGNIKTVYVPFKDQFIGKIDVDDRLMQLMHLWILE